MREVYLPGSISAQYQRLLVRFASLSLFAYLVFPQASYGQADANEATGKSTGLTVSCMASPSKVQRGEMVNVVAHAEGSDLIYGFGSSDGTLIVQGDSTTRNSATLNTAGISKDVKAINIVCIVINPNGMNFHSMTQVTISTLQLPADMAGTGVEVTEKPPKEGYDFSTTIAPTLSWTTGTQTQWIAGGSAMFSAVHSDSYCDPGMRQFGIVANASNTSTTKTGASTINLDNNDVRVDATRAIGGYESGITKSYLGVDADFFGNNSLGLGLQQTYAVQYQYFLRSCTDIRPNVHRAFASLGVGAGFMNQRLYKTQDKLNAAVLPLSARFSYLFGENKGIPPKLILFVSLGFLPVLNDMHAYQLSAVAGLQIPTKYPWLTLTLSETELYMNNAPATFKRNYQNGSIALVFSLPPNPHKQPNPNIPESVKGACYGGDKFARLYCYDGVTKDECGPTCLFRPKQVCSSAGPVPLTSQ